MPNVARDTCKAPHYNIIFSIKHRGQKEMISCLERLYSRQFIFHSYFKMAALSEQKYEILSQKDSVVVFPAKCCVKWSG